MGRWRRRRTVRHRTKVLGAAVGLGMPGAALADEGIGFERGPQVWVRPGAVLSYTFGRGGGLGLGADLSLIRLSEAFGAGGFGAALQGQALITGSGLGYKAGGGLQAIALPLYGEAGWSVQRASLDTPLSHGPAVGGFGAMAIFHLGLRATMPAFGERLPPQVGIELSVGMPYRPGAGFDILYPRAIAGRPLRVGDGHRLSPIVAYDGAPEVRLASAGDAGEEVRARLRERWLDAAAAEDASVPAFLRLADDLAAVGAPPALVSACLDAAADEARHAAICFAFAGAYGKDRYGAGLLDVPADPVAHRAGCREGELVRLAIESFEDGCIGEGVAASQASASAAVAREPRVSEGLFRIATDEARHASLAWAVLGWCLSEAEAPVRDALRVAIRRAADRPAPLGGAGDAKLEAHGVLSAEREAAIARDVAREATARLDAALPV